MAMTPCYVTRDRVQLTLDQADTLRSNRSIDRAIASASRDAEGQLGHLFYPTTAVLYPDPWRHVQGGILWLDDITYEMASVTSLVVDGVTWTVTTDFYLDPEDGPPYTSIRIPRTSDRSWPTDERSIVLTGQRGASVSTRAAGTLATSVNTSVTSVTVSDSAKVGVGDLLSMDSERVVVTDKTLSTTAVTLSAILTAVTSDVTLSVSDGTGLHEGETIVIGSERMFIEMIAGNSVTVKRSTQGSVLATHAISDVIYAPRTCIVERGCTGTTAASHTAGAALAVNHPDELVQELALAFALNNLEQGKSGYARTTGSGESEGESSGRGVKQILEDAMIKWRRVKQAAV